MKDIAMWDVQYSIAPMEGRSWRANKRTHVLARDIKRAIALVEEKGGEDVQVHQVLKRSSDEVIIDDVKV